MAKATHHSILIRDWWCRSNTSGTILMPTLFNNLLFRTTIIQATIIIKLSKKVPASNTKMQLLLRKTMAKKLWDRVRSKVNQVSATTNQVQTWDKFSTNNTNSMFRTIHALNSNIDLSETLTMNLKSFRGTQAWLRVSISITSRRLTIRATRRIRNNFQTMEAASRSSAWLPLKSADIKLPPKEVNN